MKQPLVRFWKLIKSERKDINSIILLAAFHGLVGLSLPLGIQAIITFLQTGELSTSWAVLVALVLTGILISGWMQIRQMVHTEGIEQRLFVKAAFDYAYRTPRFSLQQTAGTHFPEMMNRFFEVFTIQKGFSKLLIDLSTAVIQIFFGMVLLALYHPLFILIAVVLGALLILLFRLTGRRGLKSSLEESAYKYAVAHWLEELARNIYTFRHAADSDIPLKKTDECTSGYLEARNRHFKVLKQQYAFLIAFKLLVAAALLVLGSILVLEGSINIGQFVAAEIVILMVINSVEKIVLQAATAYDLLTSLEKAGNVADLPLERHGGENTQSGTENGMHIRASQLNFTFPDGQSPVITNINFELKPGESLCISGEQGGGKTALLRLLTGEFEQAEGILEFDGIRLNRVDLPSLRRQIGATLSEQHLFKGSLLDNITCGRPGIDLKHAQRIASEAGLGAFIEQLPAGIHTMLHPEGKRLSSGTVRSIIQARCIVGQPRLVIADDAVLPSLAEQKQFIQLVRTYCPAATMIMVSNRAEIASAMTYQAQMKNGNLEFTSH